MNRLSQVFLTVSVFLAACSATKSTHHASVRVSPDHEHGRMESADTVTFKNALEAWAERAGFAPHDGPRSQSFFSSAADGDEVTICYIQTASSREKRPIELLTYYDPDAHPFSFKVALSEGYGTEPSADLNRAYETLMTIMSDAFGEENVRGSIW